MSKLETNKLLERIAIALEKIANNKSTTISLLKDGGPNRIKKYNE